MRTQRSSGFSLVEAILVITIGSILLASSTVMYQQYRQSVGDTSALQRVVALQSAVESVYAVANGNSYPSLTTLQGAWAAKRPMDFNTSPWGGMSTGTWGGQAGLATDGASVLGGPSNSNNADNTVPDANLGDSGLLYYWTAPASGGVVGAPDAAGGNPTVVYYRNFLVTIVPNNAQMNANGRPSYVFVRGSQPITASSAGTAGGDMQGIVGDGSSNLPNNRLF